MLLGRYAGIAKLLISGGPILDDVTGVSIDNAGMGILVDPRHVLTCAHVVNTALHNDPEETARPTRKVKVVFPLLKAHLHAKGKVVELKGGIAAWFPMGGEPVGDVAVIELDEDAPADVGLAKIIRSGLTLDGNPLHVFGCPAGDSKGGHVDAEYKGLTADGTVQIDKKNVVGAFIQGGYSGAAVWDVEREGVVGMVSAAHRNAGAQVAYMIPGDWLKMAWPKLRVAKPSARGTKAPPQLAPENRQTGKGVREVRCPYPGPPVRLPEPFEDRKDQTLAIEDFLKKSGSPLLVVEGRAGQGKTALVCRVLESLRAGVFPESKKRIKADGVIYLSPNGSYPITAPNLFAGLQKCLPPKKAQEVGHVLRNPKTGGRARMMALLDAVGQTCIAVLLDSFETLLDDGDDTFLEAHVELKEAIVALLKHPSHGAKVIMTSQVVPSGLESIQPGYPTFLPAVLEGLPGPYAERVLKQRNPRLIDAPEKLLREVTQLTGGNPRALEAVGGGLWAKPTLTLNEILNDIKQAEPGDVTDILVGKLFDRLSPPARKVMQGLAIYRQPVNLEAIEYLLGPYIPVKKISPLLDQLFRWYAVRRIDDRLYFLHSTDQAYAIQKIPIVEKRNPKTRRERPFTRSALLSRAADFFRDQRKPHDQWLTKDDIAPQLSEFNLRFEAGEYAKAAELLLAIDNDYLSRWGLNRLVVQMHELLLGHLPKNKRLRYESDLRLGNAYLLMAKYAKAAEHFEKAVDLAKGMDDPGRHATALSSLGRCRFRLGNFDGAIQEQQTALAIAAKLEVDKRHRALIQANYALGFSYSTVGDTTKAVEYGQAALEEARLLGDRREESLQLGYLGLYASYQGKVDLALDYDSKALELARQVGARREETYHLAFLAEVHVQRQEYDKAIECATESLKIEAEIENSAVGLWSNQWLAAAHCLKGDLEKARAAADAACRYDEPLCNQDAWAYLGVVAFRQGDAQTAGKAFAASLKFADALIKESPKNWEALDTKGLALCGMAIAGHSSQLSEAIVAFKTARSVTRDAGIVRRALLQLDMLAPADHTGLLEPARAAAAGAES